MTTHKIVAIASAFVLSLGMGLGVANASSETADTQALPKCKTWVQVHANKQQSRIVRTCPLVKGGYFNTYGPWVWGIM